MRQKHEGVKKFQYFESIESELKKASSATERTAAATATANDTSVTMLSPPRHYVKRVKVIEDGMDHLEQFSNQYDAQEDSNGEENARVLVAQSEPDILFLIRQFSKSRGIEIASSTTATNAFYKFEKRNRSNKPFEIVVLDTHLIGNRGLDLANKIHQINPRQRIIVITTTPKHLLRSSVKDIGFLNEKDILIMPFKLMDLVSLLEDGGQDNNRCRNNITKSIRNSN